MDLLSAVVPTLTMSFAATFLVAAFLVHSRHRRSTLGALVVPALVLMLLGSLSRRLGFFTYILIYRLTGFPDPAGDSLMKASTVVWTIWTFYYVLFALVVIVVASRFAIPQFKELYRRE